VTYLDGEWLTFGNLPGVPAEGPWWTVVEPLTAQLSPNVFFSWSGLTFRVVLGPPPGWSTHPDVDDSVRVVFWYRDGAGVLHSTSPDGKNKAAGTVEITGYIAWETASTDVVEVVGAQLISEFRAVSDGSRPPGFTTELRDAGQPTRFGGVTAPAQSSLYWGQKIATDPATLQDEPVGALGADPGSPGLGWVADPDRSAGLIGWSVDYGRSDSTDPTRPVQVTVGLAAELAGPCPPIGEPFRLALAADAAAALDLDPGLAVRFTGEVTDAIVDTVRGVHTVTGVGRLGRASRRPLSPRWPREDDGARMARILAAVDLEVGTIDPGTAALLSPNPATAGALIEQVVQSTGGQVVEQPTGVVDWHDAEHRRGAVVALTLDASEILNDVKWQQHVGDVVNSVQVSYGPDETEILVTDPTSIEAREVYPARLSTALVTASDAHSLGSLILSRRSLPVWQLPALSLDLRRTATAAKLPALLALRHGDRIEVTGLPVEGPYAGTVEFFVEGYTEAATGDAWRLALSVSDPTLSGVAVRWADVDPPLTWLDVDPTLTWLDLGRIEDAALLGTPDGLPDLLDGGTPGAAVDGRTIDGGGVAAPSTLTDTIDGGTP
jgi:hypothetical protein